MSVAESKQMTILRAIYDAQTTNGYPPTVREIGQVVGLSSSSTIHGHIERLVRKGYLNKDANKPRARAIEVTVEGRAILGVNQQSGRIPLLGTVTAGQPILAVETRDETNSFPIPDNLAAYDGHLFMLDVQGDSMINIGILNGDKVIVRQQSNADNGEVVVAMTDDNEVTVKRFFKERNHYRLQPENNTMSAMIFDSITILGKVVGLYRDAIY